MKVVSCMDNTRLLTVLVIGLIFYAKLTNAEQSEDSYVVFMFEEKSQQFKPSCKCHIEGPETSPFHKKFKLEEDGPMYDLCYAGSYVAEITPTEAVCKPCINGTYNPSPNACSYCLMCRTCVEHENKVTTECSSTVNRICECKRGDSCDPDFTTPAHVRTSTNGTVEIPQHTTPSSTSYQQTLSSNPQTTGTVTTLPSIENSTCPPCECEIETKWKKLFIVSLVVSGIIILSLVILIVVLLKPSRTEYQEVVSQEIPMEEVQIDSQCTGSLEETLPMIEIQSSDSQQVCNGSREERLPPSEIQRNDIIIGDHVIELLVKKIAKDYNSIGIALGLDRYELDQIEMNHKNNVRDAVRNMLFKARQMRSSDTQCEEFIKAFQNCNRQDLVDIVINDARERRVDLPISAPENGTDKSLHYPTEEADESERRSTTSSSHSCS